MIRSPVFELDCADLVVIAGRVLGIGPAAALDRLDFAAAQAALTDPDPTDVLVRAAGGERPARRGREWATHGQLIGRRCWRRRG